ncbi:CHAP domain-containing protein [Falsiroseomonas sp.]|uniref:CHAP domain-containing protein n=1 Tax=Falsiroseomonas sp. TaxID=2870721 RepID=UPI003566B051
MRAECALAAVFVLFGTIAATSIADAAERESWEIQVAAAAQPRPVTLRQAAPGRPGIAQPAMMIGAGTPILPVSATSGLSCVPFARMATGVQITGDARLWWHNAAGRYLRGQQPERGAVMAFMASGGMRRGHVAVVSRVVDDRTVLIDHSNWAGPGIRRGTVMRGVLVVDVSDRNDWTAVRVQVGRDRSALGRTYPIHGFIYNRPVGDPSGERILTASAPAAAPLELAEASSPHAALHMRLAAQALAE